jgi:hypothetical protein
MRAMAAVCGVVGALVIAGCTSITSDGGNIASSVSRVSGDSQRVYVGSQRTTPLVVVVKNGDGSPMPGVSVVWSIAKGGGALDSAGTLSDASGQSRAVYVTSDTAGEATIHVVSGRGTTDFTVTLLADTVGILTAASGNGTAALLGFPITLIAKAHDKFNNPIPNVAVSWAAATGTLANATNVTGANGQATAQYTLGPAAGKYVATATSKLNNISFTLDGVAAPAK